MTMTDIAERTSRRPRSGPRVASRTAPGWVDAPYTRFTVSPVTPTIGAEIGDIDLREPLDDETFAELHRALLEWKVLFFRDQHLDADQHEAMGRRWGELEWHPFAAPTLPGQDDAVSKVVRLGQGRQDGRPRERLAQRRHVARVPVARFDPARRRGARRRRRHAVGRHGRGVRLPRRRPQDPHRRPARRARLVGHVRPRDDRRRARGAATRLPGRRAPGRAHPPRDRPQDAVRQRRLHAAHRRPRSRRERRAPRGPLRPGRRSPSSSAGSAGTPGTSRSGTTARRSTTRPPTTSRSADSWSASRSSATARSELDDEV